MSVTVISGTILILIGFTYLANPVIKLLPVQKYYPTLALWIFQCCILFSFGVYVILLGPASMTYFNLSVALVISGFITLLAMIFIYFYHKKPGA